MITKDLYELKLHRLVHPSDFATNGPIGGVKKPYILLHGLIGSSASFIRSTDYKYQAPSSIFNASHQIHESLLRSSVHDLWKSTSDRFEAAYEGDNSIKDLSLKQRFLKIKKEKRYSSLNEIDYYGDNMSFGSEYKQAYKNFELPNSSKNYISNSLAFTLSNFGYDVWLINLRGNAYSRKHHGRYSADSAEYWNFNIDTLIREDLLASINKVKQISMFNGPLGFISYSYSSLNVLGLLSKFPAYQETLQPIVMMAPTLQTGSGQSLKFKYFLRLIMKTLIAHNGPFPALGREKEDKIERLICKLPVASNLCNLFQHILYGRSKSINVPNLILPNHKTKIINSDAVCGQTSTAVLHQIIDNLSLPGINPNFVPFVQARNKLMRGQSFRRSIILIHSRGDKISTIEDVEKIRDSALKSMVLIDLVINESDFDHTDFLFSKQNQYLVNGEIARIVSLFDFMIPKTTSGI